MISIGARAHDYGRKEPENLFPFITSDGFAGIQLAPKKAISGVYSSKDITPELLGRIKISLQKNHLRVPVYGAYFELALTDEKRRREGVSEFKANIFFASCLGADCIATETTSMAKQPAATRKEAAHALLRSLWDILPEAEEKGVPVAIEPAFLHTINTPELAADILNTVRSEWLRVIFDPVNLLFSADLPSQDRIWYRFFELLSGKIAAVHIKGRSYNRRDGLKKSPLKESVIHYRYISKLLKYIRHDIFILREEIDPRYAKDDVNFLESVFMKDRPAAAVINNRG